MVRFTLIFLLVPTMMSAADENTSVSDVERTTTQLSIEGDSATKYYKYRTATIAALKNGNKEDHPYPQDFNVTSTLPDFIEKYSYLEKEDVLENITLSIAGRIHSITDLDRTLILYGLKADGVQIQVIVDAQMYGIKEKFANDTHKLSRGDIIGCTGHPGKDLSGELLIAAKHIRLLSPCLHQLPQHLEPDNETRFRKRYLDLILSNDVRSKFYRRAQTIAYIRRFLDELSFLEIETPILNLIPGGATAVPFVTHHKETNLDFYMRIAPELYHKMVVVGGLDRVYEIGRQFRNEEIDQTHNPEFTSCELYMAYVDYNDLMSLTEKLLSGLVKSIFGSYKVKYHPHGPEGEEVEIDFTPPFARVSMMPALEKMLNVKLPADGLDTPETNALMVQLLKEQKIDLPSPATNEKLLDRLTGKILGDKYLNPTFIIDYPQFISPLAKYHRNLPGIAERFELYVMRKELCNGYTELNDPETQRELFKQQEKQRAAGDEEIPPTDEGFLTALEYGLPPAAGLGIGLDRLIMMLTDSNDIREVLLFPTMKPE